MDRRNESTSQVPITDTTNTAVDRYPCRVYDFDNLIGILGEPLMGMKLTALMVMMLVLVCPYTCIGSARVSDCGDPSCPSGPCKSQPNAPRAPSGKCDSSCGGCLCGGAVSSVEIRPDYEAAQNASLDHLMAPILVGQSTHISLFLQDSFPKHSRRNRCGPALCALFQSFLL